MLMNAIAIDDEPLALEVIRSHAAKVPFLELKECFTDAFEAMDFLQRETVNLLFLDIKMPDISGMDFAKSLTIKPMIVFTTAYSAHAVQGFELDAVDYLLKPFSLSRFLKACNKARELQSLRHPGPEPGHLFLKSGYETVRVALDDILYVESAGNYMNFVTTAGRVLARMSMAETLEMLPEGRFIRIHRSFIISRDKIGKMDRQQVWIDGVSIPVGASYTENLPVPPWST
jgi:DNA-binding LytR/AlgR family response regulator